MMEALYHDTNLKLEEIKTYISTYEKCSKTHEPQIVKDIDEKLAVVSANCQKLEAKVDHEPPARRLVSFLKFADCFAKFIPAEKFSDELLDI